MNSNTINKKNALYWNEVCGTHAAKAWGIKNKKKESLKKFDDLYFNYYPFLSSYIPFKKMNNKKILEIGPGYGSVSSKILSTKYSKFTCIDIAKGPLDIVKTRVGKKKAILLKEDFLTNNFENESFDYIVAIGCLHHTGKLQKAIDECYRILKKNGVLIGMVYYAYSYRRWATKFSRTLKFLFENKNSIFESDQTQSLYDINQDGDSPPATEYVSKRNLKKMCKKFSNLNVNTENLTVSWPFYRLPLISRERLINTFIAKKMGLDLYFNAYK